LFDRTALRNSGCDGAFFLAARPNLSYMKEMDTKMPTEYSPHATAYAARCKPETLRDWRVRGFFNDLGERKGKGHMFTLSDVARIVVAGFIARNGARLREAFEIVGERGRVIDTVVAGERNAPGAGNDYYLSFVVNPDCSFPESVTNAPVSNIQFDTEPTAVLQVNVSKLIRAALQRLDIYEDAAA
jgi:hypothetical protein